ncbi:MAG: DUF4369 domain-containing protein [Muribaculum sp.]|nr:DUF4369 domain-containing protein [Muribaculaceae bacterium]MCM1080787.1 DUF4369 domain-containing protein [Muribaculum sp.]
MLSRIKIALAALTSLLLAACGDDSQFRIEGTVEGLGTRSITLTYVDGNNLRQITMVAIDGKFSLTGTSKNYTIAELSTSNRTIVARMLVKNGETLKCKLNLTEPDKDEITGNGPTERWAAFLREKADSLAMPSETNRIIRQYVTSHKGDIVSSALMLTAFNSRVSQLEADSLISTLNPEARPESLVDSYRFLLSSVNAAEMNTSVKTFVMASAGDSMERYYPIHYKCTMLAFTGREGERRDTIRPVLKALRYKYKQDLLHIIEISTAPDSLQWRNEISADSATWTQVWAPALPAHSSFDDLQLPYIPYYIVSDSIGRPIYRGPSATEASAKTMEFIKVKKYVD